ncbi:prophage ps3 protein 01 [Algibacter lectus]|uniref:Prophage ps3 protein 01 n=1 Tax=Algibacter lectus TaxID=221126 RepID=A0A090WZ05_9FLAO|nr:type II toxin-antitoxin system antitoxin SocA domain-containing protein [Algibacter lectus]GAL82211.1 prophage ps3 protein 01 [Algibacter lectus]
MKTTVFDIVKYILSQTGGYISAVKLQKLVYYSQAWSLVWDDKPLFDSKIEAWVDGPVVPDLYQEHKGKFTVSIDDFNGDVSNLSSDNISTIDEVLKAYSDKNAQWLSDLTHMEDPWLNARKGLLGSQRGNNEITLDSMGEYYSSL